MNSISRAALPILFAALASGQTLSVPVQPRVFIEPQNGFESYISAAIIKKHVPVIITESRDSATFVLTSRVIEKTESTGSKVARCLFLYCAGMEGMQTATVQLIDKNSEVAWAYNVRKASASAYQSTAEAIAKHLKGYLEKAGKK
jgi:hypothetical protein